MKPEISPSMMCADIFDLKRTLDIFAENHIEYLHIDVMDGQFVPNYSLGTDFCKQLRKMTRIPFDFHLMVADVDNKFEYFDIQSGDIVAVHVETSVHLQRTLSRIRKAGAHPFVALNPATPISSIEYVLDDIDGVLLMTVNPGFAGQSMVPSALKKISDLRCWLDSMGRKDLRIEVDGNVSFEKSPKMCAAGADLFVGGSSSVFFKEGTLGENIVKMRQVLNEAKSK